MPMPSATRQPRFPRQSSPACPDQLRPGKDERADVTTDGQVSLSNGTHVSGPFYGAPLPHFLGVSHRSMAENCGVHRNPDVPRQPCIQRLPHPAPRADRLSLRPCSTSLPTARLAAEWAVGDGSLWSSALSSTSGTGSAEV